MYQSQLDHASQSIICPYGFGIKTINNLSILFSKLGELSYQIFIQNGKRKKSFNIFQQIRAHFVLKCI